jgi:hypothetical protein
MSQKSCLDRLDSRQLSNIFFLYQRAHSIISAIGISEVYDLIVDAYQMGNEL